MDENQVKHLEMIQNVINRMSSNSFSIKGWSITLVAALFALAAKDSDPKYVIVSYFSIAMFWILDSYYLYQERLYKKLYSKITNTVNANLLFSMDTTQLEGEKATWHCAAFSKTILIFHGTIFLIVILVMLYLLKNC